MEERREGHDSLVIQDQDQTAQVADPDAEEHIEIGYICTLVFDRDS